METEFLHDYENFSSFSSQGSGLNIAGTFFEKVIDHELAFRDDIPQEDFWFSPLDEFGSSSLSPNALALRGDDCDFSLRDLNPAFDVADFQSENISSADLWNTSSDVLAGYPDFLSANHEINDNICDSDENLLPPTRFPGEKTVKSELFRGEDETPVDVETVDAVSGASKFENDRQSFQQSVTSHLQPIQRAKPVKPNSGSLLEAHLRSPIQTIINAAHRPSSFNSCTRLNNCKIIRESPSEYSNKAKAIGRKQKIPIAQAIPNKKLEGTSNRMIDAGRTLSRNKLIKLVTTGSSGETILLDHDYCSNSAKSSFATSAGELGETKKVPMNKCEPESVHASVAKVAIVKTSNSALKPRGALKDCGKTKVGKSLATDHSFSDDQNVTLSKISKAKNCDNETAFRKDIFSENIFQNSVTKSSSKDSVRVGDAPPCDNKIAQNASVTVNQKVPLQKPVMVSLLSKSTIYKGTQNAGHPNSGADNDRKSSSVKAALVSINTQAGAEKSKLCNGESGRDDSRSTASAAPESKESNKKQKFKSIKKAKNNSIDDTQRKESLMNLLGPEKFKSLSSSKSNAQPERFSKSDSHISSKKLKHKTGKKDEVSRDESISFNKDTTKSAKTVNNSFKNNFKSDSTLPIRNSNVISSDVTKEGYPGSQSSSLRETTFSNDLEAKENVQNLARHPANSRKSERPGEDKKVFEAKINQKVKNTTASNVISFQRVDVSSNKIVSNYSKDVDSSARKVKSAENHRKDLADREAFALKKKERSDLRKTEDASKNIQSESAKNVQACIDLKELKSETGTCLASTNQAEKAVGLKPEINESIAFKGLKAPETQDTEAASVEISSAQSVSPNVSENSVLTCSQAEDVATEKSTTESQSSGVSGGDEVEPASIVKSSEKEESGRGEKSTSGGKKRKLNLAEYRDRQRKRLDPGVTLTDNWVVPLIELDSSVTDPANRSSYKDLINSTNDSKPKIIEPLSTTEDITVVEIESEKTEEDESTKQVEKVESIKKAEKDVESTKKIEKDAESTKKLESKEPTKSAKEKSTKRRSSSRNGSDRSSDRRKRSRSSRSSSSSNKSPRRDRRRTPISYRPCSRSSYSSTSSSSRSESRSRSHSRSRSYRNRSYGYRRDSYQRRSRDSDRRDGDYYRYRDSRDRRRSRDRRSSRDDRRSSRDDRRSSRDDRRSSRNDRRRSREDRRRSREKNQGSKSYRRDRSSSMSRKTRSISPVQQDVYRPLLPRDYIAVQDKAIEEGRMIYVGKITGNMSRSGLRDRFEEFGPVLDVSLHFRENKDSYGFVTFKYADDARDAIKYGNDDKSLPQYDICYGGRRQVCSDSYSDLSELYGLVNLGYSPYDEVVDISTSSRKIEEEDSFDALLQDFRRAVSERTQKEI